MFLALTLRSGKLGLRKSHFYLVGLTFLSLLGAIWQAELYGRDFEFNPTRLTIHLGFASSALASFPGVIYSGYKLLSKSAWRYAHKRWVGVFVSLVVLSIITAVWMFVDAQSKS
jgi:hypothetical protein